MPPPGILRRVALVTSDVSEELSPSIFSERRLLVTGNVIPSSQVSFDPDDGVAKFFQNVGSYKSHTA
jgi:hypothetical protein